MSCNVNEMKTPNKWKWRTRGSVRDEGFLMACTPSVPSATGTSGLRARWGGDYFFLSVLLFWVLETTVTQILAVIVHPLGTCGQSETSGYRPIPMDGEKEKSMKQWSMRLVVPWSLFLYCLPPKNCLWRLPLWSGLRGVIKGRELAFERKAWDITTRQQRLAAFPYWNVLLVYLIIHTQHSEMTEKWTHVALWSSVMRK